LASELTKAMQSAELKGRFATEGVEPSVMSHDQLTRFVANEIQRWRKVAQASNIQPE
jgi:tripartite-type tricarboxylate transporter receptor subunit TctC